MSRILLRAPSVLFQLKLNHGKCVGLCLWSKDFSTSGVRNFGGWVTPKVNDIIADPRFPLPDRLGESWKVRDRYNVSDLTQLVDRSNLCSKRLHIQIEECPYLLGLEVMNMFPLVMYPPGPQTIIKLSYEHFADDDLGRRYFYYAGRTLAAHLRSTRNYINNFINPFTGEAYINYSEANGFDVESETYQKKKKHLLNSGPPNPKYGIGPQCLYFKDQKNSEKIGKFYLCAQIKDVHQLCEFVGIFKSKK